MGRFTLVITLGVGVWLSASGMAGAWPGKDDKNAEAAPAAAAPAAAAKENASARARDALNKAMKDWQTKLSDSRWDLEVKVSGGGPAVVESDVLTFEHGSVGSDVLAKAGYKPASYALYPPTEQSIGWEAMQLKEDKGVKETAIWRGEVTGDMMQGTLIRRRTDGDKERVEQFAFTGRLMAPAPKPIPPVVQSEPQTPVPTPEVPAAAPKGSGGS